MKREALAGHRWNELDAGARGCTVIYPLHTGDLGATAHTVLNAVLGLALAGLAFTGIGFWWMRRGAARDHRHRMAPVASVRRTTVRKPFG